MTYKQLSNAILKMTEEQQNMDVTIYSGGFDEFHPMYALTVVDEDTDVLDINHPVIVIDPKD